ncbi:hypothetical protein BD324DRAFT_631337 [Kockovaella imperatae]|uniref:DUF7587 domain-containing protein n=1 Tax=Kockovaella imperatae TaxID=4999 RepID=A0A1Y1UDU0_9TREE|nr:hypothetical protein BD324DRAFT_631337 [Kockovaella imperatae]ORX35707.1 hypothetical protein BD324DRAFT_631337 [Kockovaella imperatae]
MWSVQGIIDDLESRRIVLRVHDHTSLSRYEAEEGFIAEQDRFDNLSKTQFHKRYGHLRYDYEWKRSSSICEYMVDHIFGGWDDWSLFGRDGPSPWISTTIDFDWAIYEIARRLTVLNRGSVRLSVIDLQNSKRRRVGVRPDSYIPEDTYDESTALSFARASSEILFYGKIFDEDIPAIMVWTRQKPARRLPPEYKMSKKQRDPHGDWIDNLCFNPRRDSFRQASARISARRDQIASSRC